MTRAKGIIYTRVALIVGALGSIELLCRLGMIEPLTMIAPSQMAFKLARMVASGELAAPAAYSFMEVWTAFAVSVVAGGALGALVRSRACVVRSRSPAGELVRGAVLCVLSIASGVVRFERAAIDRHRCDIRYSRDDAKHSCWSR
jgi:ABC-type nitrate/sulfonate/bicarbonate transport system permease component